MENNILPQAVDIVKQAMAYDANGDYENALVFYRRSLEYFMVALKYETNPTSKATIMSRVEGYMKRAEQLKQVLDNNQNPSGRKTFLSPFLLPWYLFQQPFFFNGAV